MSDTIAEIRLVVEHNKLRLLRDFTATTQTVNSVRIDFEFRSSEWLNLTKTAVFTRKGIDPKLVLLEPNQTSCDIPWEVLDLDNNCNCDGTYEVGIFGVGADGARLPTNTIKLKMIKGCYCQGETPRDPTPDIYEQLVALLQGGMSEDEIKEIVKEYCANAGLITEKDIPTAVVITEEDTGYVKSNTVYGALSTKVDKIDGKSLSKNDFTDDYKLKLDGVESGANKTVVDDVLDVGSTNPIQNKVVKAEIDAVTQSLQLLDSKKADTTSIPTKISDLENDSGFITNTVNDLVNYYLTSETYTKDEVLALISAIKAIQMQIVEVLPETGESNIIYLVLSTDSTDNNIYDEFIYINDVWEQIGTTAIDLNNYVTKDYNATYGRLGLVKTSQLKGLGLSDGLLYVVRAIPTQIAAKTDEWCPITPKDVDYVVKVGVTTNTETLTKEEQTAAKTWLGVPTKVADLDDVDDYATKTYVDDNGGKINSISVNGTTVEITNKNVDITVPTLSSTSGTSETDGYTQKYINDNFISETASYSDLTTTYKTVIGAINEVNAKPSGGDSSSFGLSAGQTINKLYFNTNIAVDKLTDFISNLTYSDETLGVEDSACYILHLNNSDGIELCCLNFNLLGGNGYGLGIVQNETTSGFILLQPVFITEYSEANIALIQNFIPDFTYSEPGWLNSEIFTMPNESTILSICGMTSSNTNSNKVSAFVGATENDVKMWDILSMLS